MKPKEKAEELLNKYFNAVEHRHTSRKLAKKLSLIIVDEIIKDFKGYIVKHYLTLESAIDLCEYWKQVKIELNNL